jgi:flagellum-specific peptidoglycan hydrolase FlgJ
MIKKLLLFVFAITFLACSSSKPVVRTTKSSSSKPKTHVAHGVRKPVVKSGIVKTQSENKQEIKTVLGHASSSEILEATTRVKVTTQLVLAYIDTYKDVAKENMIKNGIPSSIILGQAILESGAGTGPLSVQANNHFGIKCHKEWSGPSIKYTDDAEDECFRRYEDSKQSFMDHSYFLTSRPRYSALFRLDKNDYKSWAKGLKAAGYATDPKYSEKLISLIERYQLDRFDSEVLGKEYAPIIYKDQYIVNAETYEVVKGDTLYSISKKYNLSVEELKKKNNLSDSAILLGQSLIIK